MEEVDEIVIHTLRQIGCDIKDEVSSLREFSTDLVIMGVAKCLKLMNPELEVPNSVPHNMSARYRLGAALATECSSLGYKGEIGYQTFLYSNEGDLRRIFLFLIENLPKESEKVLDQPLGKLDLILKENSEYFKECLNTPWLPYYCRSKISVDNKFLAKNILADRESYASKSIHVPYFDPSRNPKRNELYKHHCGKYFVPLVKQFPSPTILACSLLESNERKFADENKEDWREEKMLKKKKQVDMHAKAMELLFKAVKKMPPNANQSLNDLATSKKEDNKEKGSRFVHSLGLQFASPAKEASVASLQPERHLNKEEDKQKQKEEITSLQSKIEEIIKSMSQLDIQNNKLHDSIQQLSMLTAKETEKMTGIKETYDVKKRTMALLPDAENNIAKLQSLIESNSQRLISLANQWEQHRVPLIEQYRSLKELSSQRLNETQRKLEEIKQMQEKIWETGVEARHKDEMYKQLIASYEKLTKDLNRSAYTRRILEIVGNIKKQKEEIEKILLDTRNVQKEINRLSGKLERTFTVTDELIFRDAKKDESVRRAYKFLAALHENCSQLVQITKETGFIVREIRDLEDHIEQENQKKIAATLERISSDYRQMQQENATLVAKLKQ